MPTILQINSIVNAGSTGRIVEDINQLVNSEGWNSYVAYGRSERKSTARLIKIGTVCNIIIHGIQTRLFDRHGLGSINATKKLIAQIDIINPDIIHLHNLHGYYINIEILLKYLMIKDIPIVWTFHDCWPFTGHCTHFDFIGCEKWKTQCYECPQTKAYPSSFIIDRSFYNFNLKKDLFTSVKKLTIVPVSNWLGGIIEKSFFAKYPIQSINNGVDLDTFSPQNNAEAVRKKYGIGNRFMLMGVATAWSNRKGFEDYLKLSNSLADDFVIVLVGLSKNQLKIIPKTIIGIPRTENIIELSELYSAANIILNLSAEETFGLTTVEGFACGTPSIVYNCTASPELITPHTGIVIEKGDIHGLIDAIQIIKTKGKSSYSVACRERAKKFYDKNDRYQDYICLYKSILRKNKDVAD